MNSRIVRRNVLLVAALVALTSTATVRAAKPVIAPKPKHPHFLWKVESKTNALYLLGSIHAAKKELYPLPEVINRAFRKSDLLVLEVPMDFASQVAGARKMVKAATLPAGDNLYKHLDKETKKLLTAYGRKSKVSVDNLKKFRPWLVAMMIMQLELPRHGFSTNHGIDQHFVKRAQQRKMKMMGLETYDDHIGVFSTLPKKQQVEFLKETLKELPKSGEILGKMFSAWKRGDLKKLDELTLQEMRKDDNAEMYERLIVKRNNAWMKKIEKFLAGKKTYFIVVGVGHLMGKIGLVEQLRAKENYKITRY